MTSVVSVIGLGYIGLPTAAIVANSGFDVIGVDVVKSVVDMINGGGIHIFEPGLEEIVRQAVVNKNLRAVTETQEADIFLIAVPTPFDQTTKEADLTFVFQAADALAPVLRSGNLIIIESTSPVGTTRRISERLGELRADLTFPHQSNDGSDIKIAYCPERVLPGKVIDELQNNDRIVGGMNNSSTTEATEFYRVITKGTCHSATAETAELAKLTENSFRDTNIAFANELSIICDKLGVDVWKLVELVNCHPRVNVLQPSAGVGGHCIAVDPWFIVQSCPEEAVIIRTARERNDYKPKWVAAKILERAKSINAQKISCFGLAFKPDIDDFRESPALKIVKDLSENFGGALSIVEPYTDSIPISLDSEKIRLESQDEATRSSDLIVFLVKHKVFSNCEIPSHIEVLDFCGLRKLS